MMNRWYDEIFERILSSGEEPIFLKDEDEITKNKELIEILTDKNELYYFKSEMDCRFKIKKTSKKLIILIKENQKIPYDFEKKYPVLEISLKKIFPNINPEILKELDIQNLDKIYESYVELGYIYAPKNSQKFKEIIFSNEREANEDIKDLNLTSQNYLNEIEEEIKKENPNFGKISRLLGYYTFIEKGNYSYYNEILDSKFNEYIEKNFNKMSFSNDFNNAPLNSNILRAVFKTPGKKALICFDCMGYSEWVVIKNYLLKNSNINKVIIENYSLSMIPSITEFSRKSIFEGEVPLNSKSPTEEKGFKKYLAENRGLKFEEIMFERASRISQKNFLGYQAVGIIYTFIDELAHSAMSKNMMLLNIEEYLKSSSLIKVIDELLDDNFEIYICSDHGNINCLGNGINLSKWLVNSKGTRAAIYSDKSLAESEKFSGQKIYNFPQIIEGYILTDNTRRKFGRKDEGLTHGGVTVEEVVVPFITVTKK